MALRYGPSLGYKTSLLNTLSRTNALTCQITSGWKMTTRTPILLLESDKEKSLALCQKHNLTFYFHASYIVNLCNRSINVDINYLSLQLKQLQTLPGSLIVHIGKYKELGHEQGLQNVIQSLQLLEEYLVDTSKLLLENDAGAGTAVGVTYDDIRRIYEACPNFSVCLDTCHAYAAGMNHWSDETEILSTLDEFDHLGAETLRCIHLNDSKTVFGSRKDKHQLLGEGQIWSTQREGLRVIRDYARERSIDLISETKDFNADYDLLTSL